jgi:insertion element IS1 protein InsB
MAVERVRCPHCGSGEVVKYGATANGKERVRCQTAAGCGRTFIRQYASQGRVPQLKRQIGEMARNGSGVRDIGRVRQSSPTTAIGE